MIKVSFNQSFRRAGMYVLRGGGTIRMSVANTTGGVVVSGVRFERIIDVVYPFPSGLLFCVIFVVLMEIIIDRHHTYVT
jgi:hypothetical protein